MGVFDGKKEKVQDVQDTPAPEEKVATIKMVPERSLAQMQGERLQTFYVAFAQFMGGFNDIKLTPVTTIKNGVTVTVIEAEFK